MFMNLNPGMIGIRASLPEALEMAQTYGFPGVDLNITEAAEMVKAASIDEIKDLFTNARRRPGNWGLPVDWHGGDGGKWQEDLGQLQHYASLAQEIGAHRTTVVVMPFSNDLPFKENYNFHVKRLKPIAETLQDCDCRLGLEFIGPKTLRIDKKHEFVYTMEGMLGLCADLGTNVGLLLDLWHWYTAHGTTAALQNLRSADIVNVHVNDAPTGIPVDEQIDNTRCLPGETGVLDIAAFLKILNTIGYDGPVTAEPFSKRVNEMPSEEALKVTAEAMHTAWKAAGLS